MAWTVERLPGIGGPTTGVWLHELATADSDKSFTPSADIGPGIEAFLPRLIRIEFTADSTVGTRKLGFDFKDASGDILWSNGFNAATNILASTTEILQLATSAAIFTAAVAPQPHSNFLAALQMRSGDVLRILDREAIAATGDTMLIHIFGDLAE